MEPNETPRPRVSLSIVIPIDWKAEPAEVRRRLQKIVKAIREAGLDVILQGLAP